MTASPATPRPVDEPRLLWRDEHAAVLHKPSGMLVHNSAWAGPAEHTLRDAVASELGDDWHPVHRIDRGTSGAVLFARGAAIAALADALQRDDARKHYLAGVRGRLTGDHIVERPVPDSGGVPRDARSRVLGLRVSTHAHASLVRVELFTGRTHQARRHVRSLGHPVIGDANWGNSRFNREMRAAWGIDRLALHAAHLSWLDPVLSQVVAIEAPLPPDLTAPFEAMGIWPPPDALDAGRRTTPA